MLFGRERLLNTYRRKNLGYRTRTRKVRKIVKTIHESKLQTVERAFLIRLTLNILKREDLVR